MAALLLAVVFANAAATGWLVARVRGVERVARVLGEAMDGLSCPGDPGRRVGADVLSEGGVDGA